MNRLTHREPLSSVRVEELIAAGRAALGLITFIALLLDSTIRGLNRQAGFTVAFLFGAYSVAAFFIARQSWRLSQRWQYGSLAIDLAFFSALVFLTGGASSLFFVCFVFVLLSASLRFRALETGIVTAVTVVVFSIIEVPGSLSGPGSSSDLPHYVVRIVCLIIFGGLLTYASDYRTSMQNEFASIALWPLGSASDAKELMGEMLAHAMALLRVHRVVVVWEDPEEPWVYLGARFDDQFSWSRESSEQFHPLVPPDLAQASLLARDLKKRDVNVLCHDRGRFWQSHLLPIHEQFILHFDVQSVVSAPFQSEIFSGRLFFFDRDDFTADHLVLAEIAAKLLGARLERFLILQQLRESAIEEERSRVARNLHDGLLQTLTGVALQLEATERLLHSDPEFAAARIREIKEIIASDQRELRWFITDLRPDRRGGPESHLQERLLALGDRFQRQWGIDVRTHIDPLDTPLPELLRLEMYSIISEAVANAAKHASADHVTVVVKMLEDSLRITVSDDGRGFPFHGKYDLDELTTQKRGPVTLKERIFSLGGSLVIDSSSSGSTLEIGIPIMTGGFI